MLNYLYETAVCGVITNQKRFRAKRAGMPVAAGMDARGRSYLSRPAAAAFTSIAQARPSFSMDSTCVQGIFMS